MIDFYQSLFSLTPGSLAKRHIADKTALGAYICAMNGVRIDEYDFFATKMDGTRTDTDDGLRTLLRLM
jgi:hypothetical protein